ncbi:MAG: hypothetical protein IH905_05430 [Proteobacteria bacterium]|nr:hypothetical protein [Pseudomonadota bacterium]
MRSLERLGGAALALAVLSGCASIVSDNESTVYVATEPEAARCELHGDDFTRVINTPGSLVIPSVAAPVTVTCDAEDYRTTTGELDTSADGWMAGNIIFGLLGGGIGLIVDAARGAGVGEHFKAYGFPCRPEYVCTEPGSLGPSLGLRTLFMQEMLRGHVLVSSISPSYAHGQREVEVTLAAARHAFQIYAYALEDGWGRYLNGEPVKPPIGVYN